MENLRKYFVLVGVSLLCFIGYLDVTIVSTALPAIQTNLHMSVTELQWIMNAFFVGLSAFMASMGKIADIYGRRKVFYIGTLIFGFASLGAGFSTSGAWLITFRALQGIAMAISIPVGITLIQNAFTKEELPKVMGFFAAITGVGLALGPVIGGGLVTLFGWPAIFFVNIPFVIGGLVLCFFSLKESRSSTKMSLDYFGVLFLALTIGGLVFGVVEANVYGWNSPIIITSFIVMFIALILLVITERKVAHPILAGELFRNRVFMPAMLFTFAAGGFVGVVLFFNPLYLHIVLGKTIWMTGLLLFIIPIAVIISSPFIGQLNQKLGCRRLFIMGSICFIITGLGQLLFSTSIDYVLLVTIFISMGIAWSIGTQVPSVALGQFIHGDHLSTALGALFTFFNVGSAVLLAISVSLFHWRNSYLLMANPSDQAHAFTSAMHIVFWPLIVLTAIALFAVIRFMPKNR